VNDEGFVNYASLTEDRVDLDAYLGTVAKADISQLSRDERLATLINAYNAFTLRLITEYYESGSSGPNGKGRLTSIKQIPVGERWKDDRWDLGGRTVSLDELEHQIIRKDFEEPRIHWALVCAAISCPQLRREPYTGARLDEQLAEQGRNYHRRDDAFRFDQERGTVYLSSLYDWFGEDFVEAEGSPVRYAARYSDALRAALESGRELTIEYIEWDWTLNDQAIRKTRR